jgi:hypothetical protein
MLVVITRNYFTSFEFSQFRRKIAMTANVHIYVVVLPNTSMAIAAKQCDLAQSERSTSTLKQCLLFDT